MPDCELLSTCPFFNDKMQDMSEMTEILKESYCRGNYTWCGRYMVSKALERELKIPKSTVALVSLPCPQRGYHFLS